MDECLVFDGKLAAVRRRLKLDLLQNGGFSPVAFPFALRWQDANLSYREKSLLIASTQGTLAMVGSAQQVRQLLGAPGASVEGCFVCDKGWIGRPWQLGPGVPGVVSLLL